jgi:hypothetical protein
VVEECWGTVVGWVVDIQGKKQQELGQNRWKTGCWRWLLLVNVDEDGEFEFVVKRGSLYTHSGPLEANSELCLAGASFLLGIGDL